MSNFSMPSYTVLLDTNCAFSPKPENPVSEGLLKAIGKIRRLAVVEFLMPEIVMLELAYQQFRVAEQACSNMVKNAATIKAATGIESATHPTNQSLRDAAKAEIQRVLSEAGVTLIPTPYESIDWRSVVDDSCWRNSTFESPSDEEPLFEKGFRDRIILESLVAALLASSTDHSVIVSGDKLLRKAAKERCDSAAITTDIRDSIGTFLEHLQLLNKTKSEGFSKRVSDTISKYFYDSGSEACVFKSCKLAESLAAKFGAELREPNLFSAYREIEQLEPESRRRGDSTTYGQKYDPSKFEVGSGLRFKVGRTHFENSHGDARFHWKTEVEIACLHKQVASPTPFRSRPFSWIQIKTAVVYWSCEISTSDGEYSAPSIDEVSEVFGKRFLPATNDVSLLMSYDLPIFPSLSWDDDRREWEMSDRVTFEEPPEDVEEHE